MHLSTEYSINTSRCRVPEYYTRINDWQIDIKMVMADILFKSFDKGLYWYKYHIRHANNGFNVSTCICNCIEGCLNLSGALPLVVQWLDGCGRAKGSGRAAALARQSFGFDGSIPGPPLVKFWRGPVGRWVGATLQKVSKHLWFFKSSITFPIDWDQAPSALWHPRTGRLCSQVPTPTLRTTFFSGTFIIGLIHKYFIIGFPTDVYFILLIFLSRHLSFHFKN